MKYARLATRIFNTPLYVEPLRYDAFVAGAKHLFGLGEPPLVIERRADPELILARPAKRSDFDRRLRIAEGRVGIIEINGGLTHRGHFDADSTYLLGYDDIASSLDAAIQSDEVERIVLVIDSPGGEVESCYDVARRIRAAHEVKPVHAVIAGYGTSAAYWLAAAAGEISVTETALAGSIGVIWLHLDFSQALEGAGIQPTWLYAGEQKAWGNNLEPLEDKAKKRFQGMMDLYYGQFVTAISELRGLDEAAVRATEAGIYVGEEAIDVGLADRIETPDELLDRLAGNNQEDTMFSRNKTKPAAEASAETREAELDAREAELNEREAQLEAQTGESRRVLAENRAATLELEINRRLDALGTRVNLGMRQAGLTEALCAIATAGLEVGKEKKAAVEVLFSVLASIPQMTAVDEPDLASDEADAGAPSARDQRTQAERAVCEAHGVDEDEALRIQQRYPEQFDANVANQRPN